MIEQPIKMVAEAGLEPTRKRLMRPLPYLLATPQLGKIYDLRLMIFDWRSVFTMRLAWPHRTQIKNHTS